MTRSYASVILVILVRNKLTLISWWWEFRFAVVKSLNGFLRTIARILSLYEFFVGATATNIVFLF
jgi:hypothetical protein